MKPNNEAIFAANFKTTPYWWEAAAPETAPEALPGAVDVVIVGSGYAGLTAAAELARAGRSVAVLDRGDIGGGGSTRSGGMVSSGQKLVVTGAVQGLSPEQVSRLLAESLKSFDYMQELIRSESLDADLQLYGRFFGAYTPSHYKRLLRQGQLLREKTGVTVHEISREQQRSVLGSDFYYGGIVVDNYGGLHVSKYHRSLRELARSRGATLHSQAGVNGIERAGAGHLVKTDRGNVRAGKVIYATNGYTGADAAWLQRRIVPVASYQIATSELPAGLMEKLNPGRRMVSDTQRNLYYSRPSPDGKCMLFGSRPVIFDTDEQDAARRLYKAMLEVYPELAGVTLTHSWKGFVGMTFDKRAHIGERDGIYHAVGCNGNGVALMTYLGYKAARQLLGRDEAKSAFASGEFPSAFFYSGKPWFVPPATALYEIADRVEGLSRG